MLIKVQPKDGMNVRNPESGAVMAGEIMIEKSPAVIRLLKDGDLIEVAEAVKAPAKPKAKAGKGAE